MKIFGIHFHTLLDENIGWTGCMQLFMILLSVHKPDEELRAIMSPSEVRTRKYEV